MLASPKKLLEGEEKMNPITNSTIKEQMRQQNERMAQSRESQIRSQLTANLNNLTYRSKHS